MCIRDRGIENGPTTDEDSDTEDDVAGNDDETDSGSTPGGSTPGGSTPGGSTPGGPAPGGPPPRAFFETIRWEGKLKREEPQHEGLLIAIHELYQLSTTICVRQKAYEVFPVATGMILRTVYEQALKLRLMQVGLWGNYNATISTRSFPTLSGMESFVKIGVNKQTVLPDRDAQNAFDRIIAATHRDFLNANIHNPGYIRVSPDSLDGIACGGMFSLIQRFIDLLP